MVNSPVNSPINHHFPMAFQVRQVPVATAATVTSKGRSCSVDRSRTCVISRCVSSADGWSTAPGGRRRNGNGCGTSYG